MEQFDGEALKSSSPGPAHAADNGEPAPSAPPGVTGTPPVEKLCTEATIYRLTVQRIVDFVNIYYSVKASVAAPASGPKDAEDAKDGKARHAEIDADTASVASPSGSSPDGTPTSSLGATQSEKPCACHCACCLNSRGADGCAVTQSQSGLPRQKTTTKLVDVPQEGIDVLKEIARTGQCRYPWSIVKMVIAAKMEQVFTDLAKSRVKRRLAFDWTTARNLCCCQVMQLRRPPVTVQRLCEVLLRPTYANTEKLFFAVRKLLLVRGCLHEPVEIPAFVQLSSIPGIRYAEMKVSDLAAPAFWVQNPRVGLHARQGCEGARAASPELRGNTPSHENSELSRGGPAVAGESLCESSNSQACCSVCCCCRDWLADIDDCDPAASLGEDARRSGRHSEGDAELSNVRRDSRDSENGVSTLPLVRAEDTGREADRRRDDDRDERPETHGRDERGGEAEDGEGGEDIEGGREGEGGDMECAPEEMEAGDSDPREGSEGTAREERRGSPRLSSEDEESSSDRNCARASGGEEGEEASSPPAVAAHAASEEGGEENSLKGDSATYGGSRAAAGEEETSEERLGDNCMSLDSGVNADTRETEKRKARSGRSGSTEDASFSAVCLEDAEESSSGNEASGTRREKANGGGREAHSARVPRHPRGAIRDSRDSSAAVLERSEETVETQETEARARVSQVGKQTCSQSPGEASEELSEEKRASRCKRQGREDAEGKRITSEARKRKEESGERGHAEGEDVFEDRRPVKHARCEDV
ncbi:PPP4R2 [Toxoplasma gondii ARI]|uniref:PPP4R2 n=1 Tax=Toxoplasma gondii ARI TaxID=1074872 RepID=A0A139Y319_TOXGO|nr:PPP4R2 [Toxoplasma gondii ARI]